MKRLITVVVPVYNEEEGILDFLDKQLLPVVSDLSYAVEVVVVNDGSRDKTLEEIKKSKLNNSKKLRVVSLTKNFGKEIALSAGIKEAQGEAVILIDSDGQHPVEMIPRMILEWEKGAEIVTAVRDENTTRHKLGSKIYYMVMRMFGLFVFFGGGETFQLAYPTGGAGGTVIAEKMGVQNLIEVYFGIVGLNDLHTGV